VFDTERFIADCCVAGASSGLGGVLEVVSRAVSAPAEFLMRWGGRGVQGSKCSTDRRRSLFSTSSGDRRCANYPMIIGCGL
jgi:hypothetical protein